MKKYDLIGMALTIGIVELLYWGPNRGMRKMVRTQAEDDAAFQVIRRRENERLRAEVGRLRGLIGDLYAMRTAPREDLYTAIKRTYRQSVDPR